MTRTHFTPLHPASAHNSNGNSIPDDKPSNISPSPTTPTNIRLLTHNIRYATPSPFPGEEKWSHRCPRLCAELVSNAILPSTLICLQEVLHAQLVDIIAALHQSAGLGGDWAYVGVGRDDGWRAGEYSPIFYRPAVWKLDSWYTTWLSETPSVPSRGWDAANTRIATVARLIHRQTGKLVIVVSTHLDDQGKVSRVQSAKLILRTLSEEAERHRGSSSNSSDKDASSSLAAMLLAGDFNSEPNASDAYDVMTDASTGWADCALAVPHRLRYGNEVTFTGFRHESPPKRIDFVFYRAGSDQIKCEGYGVLANRFDDGVFSSDHRACVADFRLLE